MEAVIYLSFGGKLGITESQPAKTYFRVREPALPASSLRQMDRKQGKSERKASNFKVPSDAGLFISFGLSIESWRVLVPY